MQTANYWGSFVCLDSGHIGAHAICSAGPSQYVETKTSHSCNNYGMALGRFWNLLLSPTDIGPSQAMWSNRCHLTPTYSLLQLPVLLYMCESILSILLLLATSLSTITITFHLRTYYCYYFDYHSLLLHDYIRHYCYIFILEFRCSSLPWQLYM